MADSIRELRTAGLIDEFFLSTGYFAIQWEDGWLYAFTCEGVCDKVYNAHCACDTCGDFAGLLEHMDLYYRYKDYARVVSVH